MKPATWVTISRSAIIGNLRRLQSVIAPSLVMPVIKSNAYGHGLLEVAKILSNQKIWGVGVASASEALTLRQNAFKKKIVVLNWLEDDQAGSLISAGIECAVYDLRTARLLNMAAAKLHKKARLHLKYDSGTTRLGLFEKELLQLARACEKLPHVTVVGIFSHLAESESPQTAYTKTQLRRFANCADLLDTVVGGRVTRHIACTAASIRYTSARADISRIGIGLYGLWPSLATRNAAHHLRLTPALTWQTRVIQIKKVPARTPVGYGRSYTTRRPSVIAVIPVGYWDGLDRGLSNKGVVLVNGKKCPIRGRVCMNLSMVDVTKAGRVTPGTVVTLIGKQGTTEITADDMAHDSGTINYETVTRINPLLPRIIAT